MRPFSDRMYRDTVRFSLAVMTTDASGGQTPTYTPGAPLKAYVETPIGATKATESSNLKPTSRTRYRIFTPADPSIGRGRAIQVDDQVIWVEQDILLQVVSKPNPQGQGVIWLTEVERIN